MYQILSFSSFSLLGDVLEIREQASRILRESIDQRCNELNGCHPATLRLAPSETWRVPNSPVSRFGKNLVKPPFIPDSSQLPHCKQKIKLKKWRVYPLELAKLDI